MPSGNKYHSFHEVTCYFNSSVSPLPWIIDQFQTGIAAVILLTALSIVLPATAFCKNIDRLPDAINLFNTARKGGVYKTMAEAELTVVESLFKRMLSGDRSQELFQAWEKQGFTISKAQLEGREVFALIEKPEQKQGRGFYLFPLVASGSTVLMMPHGFYDLHTRVIGQYFFEEGLFLAAAWNTVHRNKYPGQIKVTHLDDDPWRWDMADLPNTCFTAFTKAFAQTKPQGHLVQLHGFAKEKRKSKSARDSDLILSDGTESPQKELFTFNDCLKIKLPFMVRLYPGETKDLGASENISARILNSIGHNGFVHMEMSLNLRQQLRSSMMHRQAVLNCMNTSWE